MLLIGGAGLGSRCVCTFYHGRTVPRFLFADLGGHKVFVGSLVNVRWKGEWYVGKVLKLGPKRNLCRVRLIMAHSTYLVCTSLNTLRE